MKDFTYHLRIYKPGHDLAFEVRPYNCRIEAFYWGQVRKEYYRIRKTEVRVEVVRLRGNRPGRPIRWRLGDTPPWSWDPYSNAPPRAAGLLWETPRARTAG